MTQCCSGAQADRKTVVRAVVGSGMHLETQTTPTDALISVVQTFTPHSILVCGQNRGGNAMNDNTTTDFDLITLACEFLHTLADEGY